MVERIKVSYRNGAYYVDRPNWDGGDVVLASDYAELEAEVERLTKERDSAHQLADSNYANICTQHRQIEELTRLSEALSRTGAVKVKENLEAIKDAILRADPNVLTDTFWMPDDVFKGGTVVDFIDHALSALEPAAPEGEQEAVLKEAQE